MAFAVPFFRHPVRFQLFRRELKHRRLVELLSRFQDGTWEVRMVRRIRKMLRLQAQSITTLVAVAFFSSEGAVQEVPTVELNPGLCSGDFQSAPSCGFVDALCER